MGFFPSLGCSRDWVPGPRVGNGRLAYTYFKVAVRMTFEKTVASKGSGRLSSGSLFITYRTPRSDTAMPCYSERTRRAKAHSSRAVRDSRHFICYVPVVEENLFSSSQDQTTTARKLPNPPIFTNSYIGLNIYPRRNITIFGTTS